MKEYAINFENGIRRTHNPAYTEIQLEIRKAKRRLDKATDDEQKQNILQQVKTLEKQRATIPSKVAMDNSFKRLRYERYADDFLIGVIGSKDDCRNIKQDIKDFLHEKLGLSLSEEKTLITHAESPAKFLGYEITVRSTNQTSRGKDGIPTRYYNAKIVLKIPPDAIKKKLLEYGALKIVVHNGAEVWKPCARVVLKNNDDLEILSRYNAEIRGFYNY